MSFNQAAFQEDTPLLIQDTRMFQMDERLIAVVHAFSLP